MSDEALRRQFRAGADVPPDFSNMLERRKTRYRPKPMALGLFALLMAAAPALWLQANHHGRQGAEDLSAQVANLPTTDWLLNSPDTPQNMQ